MSSSEAEHPSKKRKQREQNTSTDQGTPPAKRKPTFWACPNCGKHFPLLKTQASRSHVRSCVRSTDMKGTSFPLSILADNPEKGTDQRQLSKFNTLVTQSIELVEATEHDLQLLNASKRNLKRKPIIGNVGIRCIHCFRNGNASTGAISYPAHLGNLSHNIYNMATRHLLQTCQSIPSAFREEMQLAKSTTTSESMRKDGLGLPEYLLSIVTKYNLESNVQSTKDSNGEVVSVQQGIIRRVRPL